MFPVLHSCIFLLMASDRFSFMLGLSFYSLAKVIKLLKLVSLVLREERASGRLLRGSPTGPDLPNYKRKYYSVTKEELAYLAERVKVLRDMTEKFCKEQIESFVRAKK